MMNRMVGIPFRVLFISLFLLLQSIDSAVDQEVKNSLLGFLAKLNGSKGQPDPSIGWTNTTDPCQDHWNGVECDGSSKNVRKITLDRSGLSGVFDAGSLCSDPLLAASIVFIKLDENNIGGELPGDIVNCKNLTHLLLGQNQFTGNLPDSLPTLKNLKKLDVSNNKFSGNLPDLSLISGLVYFLAQYNHFAGPLPNFDFSNFQSFNVSYNNFSGPIPKLGGSVDSSSFLNNPDLCGPPLENPCPANGSISNSAQDDSKGPSRDQILMYCGYVIVAAVFFTVVLWKLSRKTKTDEDKAGSGSQAVSFDDSINKPSAPSSEYKTGATGASRSEFSANSVDSEVVSQSLLVLTSPVVNGLKFEDLLRAPAELLGRGKHGSLYKVIYENGMVLAVKRIKDWAISSSEFKERMQRIYQASHPNVLPPLAFYCSRQEKLLVYEYQQNGSLYKFLHGTQMGQGFDWISRLGVAASIAEALAFMHQELQDDGIAHGNFKSSNILLNKNMEPCVSEFGLMSLNDQDSPANTYGSVGGQQNNSGASNPFKADVYGLGVIVMELLTGKQVQSNGMDLTKWVHSVVREEWTAEVFDKSLIAEGASEERLVHLLQIAIKCVNLSPEARPTSKQVAIMINTIKEEEERSIAYEP